MIMPPPFTPAVRYNHHSNYRYPGHSGMILVSNLFYEYSYQSEVVLLKEIYLFEVLYNL